MIQNNLSSVELEQYNKHRSALIDLCTRAGAVLKEASSEQKRTEQYETPEEQLRSDAYTLVLIGEFQSGKSTLFNYLCDGRELSPVGPNGGGVRTSGCKVTAHPLEEGAEERAEVQWRSKEQLLSALGGLLTVYFEEPSSTSYLTENEIDLDKPEDRAKLADFAWQHFKENKSTIKDEARELLRFTLIVCKFYDRFADRCRNGKTVCSLEDAVRLTSYPQDWCARWLEIEKFEDETLSAFTEDKVNFAFCGGVEYFLDSGILRDLGCSIIDCPGLFISKWDSEIAERCIKDANAILYMFAGSKALTEGDLGVLNHIELKGGKHKIIFGANLRVPRDQWDNILTNAIQPTLASKGFENPVVHNFHSALALRSRELMLEEYGELSSISTNAIQHDISLSSKKEMSISTHLRRLLNSYIANLTNFDRTLTDYQNDWYELDEESGVPAFIKEANKFVVKNRATSILVRQGTNKISESLQQAIADLSSKINSLQANVEDAKVALADATQKLEKLNKDKEQHGEAVKNAADNALRGIWDYYVSKLHGALDAKRGEMITITKNHLPGMLAKLFRMVNKTKQDYRTAIGGLLKDVLTPVRDDIRDNLTGSDEFRKLRETFDWNQQQMKEKIEAFGYLDGVTCITSYLPDNFAEVSSGMTLDRAEELFEKAFDEVGTGTDWAKTILTFGLGKFFINNTARATAIIEEFMPEYKNHVSEYLKKCMWQEDPAGPLKAISNAANAFENCFKDTLKSLNSTLQETRDLLEEKESHANQVPTFYALKEQLESLQSECKDLETRIKQDF